MSPRAASDHSIYLDARQFCVRFKQLALSISWQANEAAFSFFIFESGLMIEKSDFFSEFPQRKCISEPLFRGNAPSESCIIFRH